jgi:hypothetical protein
VRTLVFAACVGLALMGSLLLLLCGIGGAAAATTTTTTREPAEAASNQQLVFEPTREWQVIPEGAAIPPVSSLSFDLWSKNGNVMDVGCASLSALRSIY